MIPWTLFWIAMALSGTFANRLGRYDDDYPAEDGYLRSGKQYSPNMHSYQAGGDHNERYADTDRYLARNLQKAPDYRRDDANDDRDDRTGTYQYGAGNWTGQHYPVKSTYSYIKPTPASSTTCPAYTTPSCMTITTSTTISRLVSICQLPIAYTYTGTTTTITEVINGQHVAHEVDTVLLYTAETDTCTWLGLPRKLIPDCCSGPSTASSSEPCYTTTFVRTILKDKTCTMNIETFYYKDVGVVWFDGELTSSNDPASSFVRSNIATTCTL